LAGASYFQADVVAWATTDALAAAWESAEIHPTVIYDTAGIRTTHDSKTWAEIAEMQTGE